MVEDTKSMISCLFLGAPQKFLLLLLFVVTADDDDAPKRRVDEAEGLNNDDCCCRNVNDMNANAVVGTVMMPVEARRYVLLIANLSFGSLL